MKLRTYFKMIEITKKNLVYFMIFLLGLTSLFAQQTNNLQVIWTIPENPILRLFGHDLAHGDIDNDGHQDILVSADTFTGAGPGISYRGRVYLFYGNNIGNTTPDVAFKSPFEEGSPRTKVYSTDLNGDGFDDIIMGQGEADSGFGKVTIFFGGNPVDTVPDIILSGSHGWPIFDGLFGDAISSGDVNGDGYNDLIIGSCLTSFQPVGVFFGRVYIYFGGPNFDTIPDIILNGGHHNDQEQFGCTVSGSGDVNNDGFSDVIVGAHNFGMQYQGRIYIYFGGNPMDTSYDVAMIGEPWDFLGEFGVDFMRNNQTFDCAITSSPLWGPTNPQGYNPGKIFVLLGGIPMDSVPDICMVGTTDASTLGMYISSAGDLNGDGCDELIAGAPIESYPAGDSNYFGGAYIWLGGALFDTIPDAWLRGIQYDDEIGWKVASAGDVDNDGRDEIIVSNYASNYSLKRVWVCKYTGPGVEEERVMSNVRRLTLQLSPNPVRSVLCVRCPYFVKEIKIYDITGKLIKTLDAERYTQNANDYEIRWDLSDENQKRAPNGIYFVGVTAEVEQEKIREIRKIVITK